MREMIVGVKCKLTDIERVRHSYGGRSFKTKSKKRNPIFKKLPCILISFLSRLGKCYGEHIKFYIVKFLEPSTVEHSRKFH